MARQRSTLPSNARRDRRPVEQGRHRFTRYSEEVREALIGDAEFDRLECESVELDAERATLRVLADTFEPEADAGFLHVLTLPPHRALPLQQITVDRLKTLPYEYARLLQLSELTQLRREQLNQTGRLEAELAKLAMTQKQREKEGMVMRRAAALFRKGTATVDFAIAVGRERRPSTSRSPWVSKRDPTAALRCDR
jgi:hypothetical protein